MKTEMLKVAGGSSRIGALIEADSELRFSKADGAKLGAGAALLQPGQGKAELRAAQDAQRCSGVIRDAQGNSGRLGDAQEFSGVLRGGQDAQGCSKIFRSAQGCSGIFRSAQDEQG